MTDALGGKEYCRHDEMGRVCSQTDREGRTSVFRYYPGGNLKEAVYPDGKSVLLSYDALNNLVRVKDWLGETCFERDEAGRIREATDHQGNTIRYEWNGDGTKKRMEYPDGQCAEYSYDSIGRLLTVTRNGELIKQNEYNGLGVRTGSTWKNEGAYPAAICYHVDYTDEYRRIIAEKGEKERTYLWQGNELLGIPEVIEMT